MVRCADPSVPWSICRNAMPTPARLELLLPLQSPPSPEAADAPTKAAEEGHGL